MENNNGKNKTISNLPGFLEFSQKSQPAQTFEKFTGAILHEGKPLSIEIERYRQSIQQLLHIFELISSIWWDRLHPFNGEFVKRPSLSADRIRKTQIKLSKMISKLTVKSVLPAATAIAILDKKDRVSILPKILYSSNQCGEDNFLNYESPTNCENWIRLALILSRSLCKIESKKQHLILNVCDWIKSDGRDFGLREQRISMLGKYIKICLIENFLGIQAIITHYYRPHSISSSRDGGRNESLRNVKRKTYQTRREFGNVTAVSFNKTNEEILEMISQMSLQTPYEMDDVFNMMNDIKFADMHDIMERDLKSQYLMRHLSEDDSSLKLSKPGKLDDNTHNSKYYLNRHSTQIKFNDLEDSQTSMYNPNSSVTEEECEEFNLLMLEKNWNNSQSAIFDKIEHQFVSSYLLEEPRICTNGSTNTSGCERSTKRYETTTIAELIRKDKIKQIKLLESYNKTTVLNNSAKNVDSLSKNCDNKSSKFRRIHQTRRIAGGIVKK